ncbi:DUF3800 domain-containing protein [Patescibacteria group bacterium]|nr:DUF3800 domain-containing protein [Patescibacteria group bacterium]MCG2695052.1 DUF3800 domain-containing protein [Candidatus Parcubacteria bacterium]
MTYNTYCDETNHLEHSSIKIMGLGLVRCPKNEAEKINERIRAIKRRHGLSPNFEIKWTKVSPAKQLFYQDIIDYFFDNDDLSFRAVMIDKNILDHAKFKQEHDDWYYKMYFTLLGKIISPGNDYFIYLDIKDTKSQEKVRKLQEILCNNIYDFDKSILKNIQQVRSHEVNVLQIADLLLGALQFINRSDTRSVSKKTLVEQIKKRSGYGLIKSTLPSEEKFNIFYWKSDSNLL